MTKPSNETVIYLHQLAVDFLAKVSIQLDDFSTNELTLRLAKDKINSNYTDGKALQSIIEAINWARAVEPR